MFDIEAKVHLFSLLMVYKKIFNFVVNEEKLVFKHFVKLALLSCLL